jgi:hypothetical protein
MQFLGPALNGRYAYGLRPLLFSGKNRSGSKTSGLGKCSGSRCITNTLTPTVHPAGIVFPPEKVCGISHFSFNI